MAANAKFALGLKIFLLIVALGGAIVLIFPALRSQYLIYLEKEDLIPDIKQTDKRLGFPEMGKDYCGPVVVMDSFVCLKRKFGYDKIVSDLLAGSDELPVESCRKLAELMGTKNGIGTSTENFLRGVKNYVEKSTPYLIRSLKYEGWNRHLPEYDNGHAVPELDWIKEGIRDNRSAWINLGWYKFDPDKKEYLRLSGHWVALIGYGVGLDGLADPNTLIVRDPDPVLSQESRKIFLTVEPIAEGILSGPHSGLPRAAKGYLRVKSMGNGIDSSRNRNGIIDGVIVLDLWPPFLAVSK